MSGSAEDLLPGEITAIRTQQKTETRFSLFVEGEFLIGVSRETLLESGLAEGDRMTAGLFRRLQQAEGRGAVRNYMLKLLARRDHSRRELEEKAGRKDLNGAYIDPVLDELEEEGYIDDRGFAEAFTEEKFRRNRWGPAKIRSHLYRKGISRRDADDAIEGVFGEKELEETLRNLVLKRKRHFLREENPRKRKKKIFDYLARKGFKPGSIYPCLERLTKAVSE